jgi:hypothetical protein
LGNDCELDVYRSANRFECISGHEFFVDGEIDFGPDPEGSIIKEYSTRAGPCYSSQSSRYCVNHRGIRAAFRRLNCVRNPERPGYHELLIQNQSHMPHLDVVKKFTEEIKRRTLYNWDNRDVEEQRVMWAIDPHPKRRMRMSSLGDLVKIGNIFTDKTWCGKENWKPKTGELLPLSKYLRGVADLTCPGSARMGYFMNYIKEAMSVPYVWKSATLQYVKSASYENMYSAFRNFDVCREGIYSLIHSDDKMICAECSDGRLEAEVDISKADSSYYDEIFRIVHECFPDLPEIREDLEGIFSQLESEFVIISPFEKKKVKLRPVRKFLKSGSVLTTLVNTVASMVADLLVAERYKPTMTKLEVSELIRSCNELCGFIVKIIPKEHPCQTTFLKQYRWHDSAGRMFYAECDSVLPRTFGWVVGDYANYVNPGDVGLDRKNFLDNVRAYNSGVIVGKLKSGNSAIKRAFLPQVIKGSLPLINRFYSGEGGTEPIPDEILDLRYGFAPGEMEHLCTTIVNTSIGTVVNHPGFSKLFLVGYGHP